ncbi:MAG: hypothetical protein HY236_05640 [Acidobacteria bacterium]|nr:hypothetical protein [Acidobacteriota bacterium]
MGLPFRTNSMGDLRLGDVIDDWCSRCRLLTNHSIVSLVNGEPVKVHCRTCFFEHNYRQAKAAARKKPSKKAELFDAVLLSIVGKPPPEEEAQPPGGRKKE